MSVHHSQAAVSPLKDRCRLVSKEKAQSLLPDQYKDRMDPYFPEEGAPCGEEHVNYMLKVVYPILLEYRSILVGQYGPTLVTLLGSIAVGDRNLGHRGPGHVHFRGLPGTGKSLLGEIPRKVVNADFKRVQGTIDLLPADITGGNIIQIDEKTERRFLQFIKGPIFSDILLIDEISRVLARSLSGVLEMMSEGTVTVGGVTHQVTTHVIATSNPDESAGSQELPDSLEDRFMFETVAELFTRSQYAELLKRTRDFATKRIIPVASYEDVVKARLFFHETIHVSEEIRDFLGGLAEVLNRVDHNGLLKEQRTRLQFSDHESIVRPDRMVLSGRGILHLEGAACALAAMRYRNYVTLSDVYKVLPPVIRHRTHFTPYALAAHDVVQEDLIREFGRAGKTTMAEYLLRHVIHAAWGAVTAPGK